MQTSIRRLIVSSNKNFDFDYFVIGGGSGGVRSSRIAAQHGARVALVESKKLGLSFNFSLELQLKTMNRKSIRLFSGGTCVNVGCVPKKIFCYGSHFRELIEDAHGYGWPKINFNITDHNWKGFIEKKNAEIQRLNNAYEKMQKDNKVTLIQGHGQLKDVNTVVVDDRQFTAKYILLAVGGYFST